jgi:ATP-grasp ribosomal peptide maturase
MTVLVLTAPVDITADLVITELAARGVPVVRMDTGAFPADLVLAARTGGQHSGWVGSLRDATRWLDLAAVEAVYYRRPRPFRPDPGMSEYEQWWATVEARFGLGGVLAGLDCRWLSHPHRIAAASYKPWQLAQAQAVGLAVPETLITNDTASARSFVAAVPNGAVYKTLQSTMFVDPSGAVHAVATTPVTAEQVGAGNVAATAHLFQHRIPKQYEVRVTVVGSTVFAVRLDAASEAARIDWRTDYDAVSYQVIELPDRIASALLALLGRLGLPYGAIDLIVDPDDRWWFLEINPNGQWGWIAGATGLPIAAAIATYLQGDST